KGEAPLNLSKEDTRTGNEKFAQRGEAMYNIAGVHQINHWPACVNISLLFLFRFGLACVLIVILDVLAIFCSAALEVWDLATELGIFYYPLHIIQFSQNVFNFRLYPLTRAPEFFLIYFMLPIACTCALLD
ncbi:hypothetical protein ACJX0J_034134, partial [Zea mays]